MSEREGRLAVPFIIIIILLLCSLERKRGEKIIIIKKRSCLALRKEEMSFSTAPSGQVCALQKVSARMGTKGHLDC